METIENYQKVYQMLEDEESKFTWLNRLNYLISNDVQFMQNIVDRYLPEIVAQVRKTLEDLLFRMSPDRNFVLFGAGNIGTAILHFVKNDKRFQGFCSNTKKKQISGYCGYPVICPEELTSNRNLNVIVSTIDPESIEEILQILQDRNFPQNQIFMLGDNFGLDSGQYFGPAFITYEDKEVFVDAGSYDLLTAVHLRDHCKKVNKVYAFEPDPQNYKNCIHNKDKYLFPESQILPYGTWSEKNSLRFNAGNSTKCSVSDDGLDHINVTTIDETVDENDRVTFIKMDVEGAELESLKGAKQIICRDKPKLAICIYHKPEDMTEIPLYIKSLVPEYKVYVRHHSIAR